MDHFSSAKQHGDMRPAALSLAGKRMELFKGEVNAQVFQFFKDSPVSLHPALLQKRQTFLQPWVVTVKTVTKKMQLVLFVADTQLNPDHDLETCPLSGLFRLAKALKRVMVGKGNGPQTFPAGKTNQFGWGHGSIGKI
jgi:hypothetical protein